jgi:hypothetical protein
MAVKPAPFNGTEKETANQQFSETNNFTISSKY